MPLDRVRIERLRCLRSVDVRLDPDRNYLYGANGAGKTSFLEGLYLLSRGRSFRTRQTKALVQDGAGALSVYAEIEEDGEPGQRIGVRAGSGGLELRVDRKAVRGTAELAAVLRVDIIDPSVHRLIEGGPSERRRFLDWGVFHVEHRFLEAWRRYTRALAQRNAALKAGAPTPELVGWNQGFVAAAAEVDEYRRIYAEGFRRAFESVGRELLDARASVEYEPGWRGPGGLQEALGRSRSRDARLGFTQVGPHRADLRLTLADGPVSERASRGQQKLFAAGLVVAQVRALAAVAGARLLLIDDPAAELDRHALAKLLGVLADTPGQKVFTALSEHQLGPETGAAVFHVEQGNVDRWYNASV